MSIKKMLFVVAAIGLMTGCTSAFDDGRQDVNCTANYHSDTFGGNQNYPVQIDQMRTNRVGHKYVHVKPNRGVQFMGRWQSVDTFDNLKCEK